MVDSKGSAARGSLVDVAVMLPMADSYTYRDPRGGTPLAIGTQVVVPFGRRRVTGFVVGHPSETSRTELKDIEAVVEDEPALDVEILELCRFIASYYLAPLGEVLRAALPQAERAGATRKVRISNEGERLLAREARGEASFASLALGEDDREVLRRLAKGRGLAVRVFERGGGVRKAQLARLLKDGLVEVGDEVHGAVQERRPQVLKRIDGALAIIPTRARAQADLWRRLLDAGAEGLLLSSLSTAERTAARALIGKKVASLSDAEGAAVAAHSSVTPPPALNADQSTAFEAMCAALGGGFAPFVLEGVTGSGKTEVYLRTIAEARRAGRGALVLVPEIALTPQLAARFRARFGDDVAVLHSGLPPAERRAAWRRLRAGDVGIALGARSAVFAPVRALGVVVVDEEHDSSFKQDDGVRYHGRDVALVRAQRAGAVAVLGSATPSLETFRNAETGRFRRLRLPVRANPAAAARPLPPIEVVDLRHTPVMANGLFSKPLIDALMANLAAREQSILFLNRRGFAPLVLCRACGHVLRCGECAVSMTYHRAGNKLVCHYCSATAALPKVCPSCRAPKLEQMGMGTERVESVVRTVFPDARIARLDRDTAGSGRGGALEGALARVQSGEVDILVGTQMVTKGHDFAGVTLVGVLLPDQGLHMPDFRAAERSFQLLEQVAGRAGRAEKPGRVIVQTYNPDHPAIRSLCTHDYEGFARAELARRQEAGYPPFARMVALRIDGPDAGDVRAVAAAAAARAAGTGVRVLGPAEAPIPLLRGRVRWQVWLAGLERAALSAAAVRGVSVALPNDVRLAVDVDPQSVL